DDNTVRFWDTDSGCQLGELREHDWQVHAVTFSPSGEFIASGGWDRIISIW
ncbi:hypothetical protein HYDPIDRAFT_66380, partial [Hydnomerulius pinastri MD-312]